MVAMLGEGWRESGKREVVNEEERGGKECESGKQKIESKDEERGGRSGMGRREKYGEKEVVNQNEKVDKPICFMVSIH